MLLDVLWLTRHEGPWFDEMLPGTSRNRRRFLRGRELRGVIFDVDGTLVDSERDGHRVAFNLAFSTHRLPYEWDPQTYGDLLKIAGGRQRIAHYLKRCGHSDEQAAELAPEIHRLKTKIFEELVRDGEVQLRPGVNLLVSDLKAAGVHLYVATTGSRDWVEPLLAQHFEKSTFDLVLTGSEVMQLKPSPAVYLKVMEVAGAPPSGVVAVEDSLNGLRAAQGADLPCLVVVNDYTLDSVDSAEAVVSSFGPGAVQLAGEPVPLSGGRVRLDTLERVAAMGRRRQAV